MHLNLVIHEETLVACSAACIWPYILQPNLWKKGVVFKHAQGPNDMRGEVFAAYLPNATEPVYHVENVEVVPGERLTIKLIENEGALIGFASWSLREKSRITRVTYDVYTQYALPSDAKQPTSRAQREALEDHQVAVIRKRFKEEFVELKRLAESDEGLAPGRASHY